MFVYIVSKHGQMDKSPEYKHKLEHLGRFPDVEHEHGHLGQSEDLELEQVGFKHCVQILWSVCLFV